MRVMRKTSLPGTKTTRSKKTRVSEQKHLRGSYLLSFDFTPHKPGRCRSSFYEHHVCLTTADFAGSQGQSKRYKKKRRTTFTNNQLQELESKFLKQKYLTKLDRCMLADSLGLTEKHIKTWYQNRRTKWKKECTDTTWSKEREAAAAAMYNQYVQMKAFKTSPDSVAQSNTSALS